MRHPLFALAIIFAALAAPGIAQPQQGSRVDWRAPIRQAVASAARTPANVARDAARHPVETLSFFGVRTHHTVVELWPGGGWYTEILAPLTSTDGALWVAAPAPRGVESIRTKLAANPTYARVQVASVEAGRMPAVASNSADVVLTFRNVHNWMMGDAPIADAVFAEAFRVLKPGGTLGVVEHRLPESADAAREKTSGYVKTSTVRAMAEKAGFRLAGSAEINANPKDTADWPKGVWTLPPNYAEKDVDRAKYAAIGESDRMTLKFVKPAS